MKKKFLKNKVLPSLSPPYKSAGFTFLEILAAITLLSLMAVGIVHSIKETAIITAKLKTRATTILSGQIALDRLQRELQMAFNEATRGTPTYFKSDALGGRQELIFSYLDTPIRTLFEQRTSGVKFARYFLEKNDNGSFTLLRSVVPFFQSAEIEKASSQILAKGILNLKFEFYAPQEDRWIDQWNSQSEKNFGRFPLAVRVSIETTDYRLPKEEWKTKSLFFQTEILLLNELGT